MHDFDVNMENPRSAKPLRPGVPPGFGQGVSAATREEEPQRVEGMKIAQTAVQSIGMSTKDPWGPPISLPQYALAVSLIFTKATNQTVILGTPPNHVLSISILWASLLHDKRFEQVPMSEATPGDIIIGSGWQQAVDGYAGIVVDHERIVSNSSHGVQNNSSLAEIQRSHPGMAAFRYVGFRNYYRSKPLANAGFNADEPRLPAGQTGGGQWTTGMAPSTTVLSGGNPRTTAQKAPVAQKANPEPGKPTKERTAEASKLSKLAQTYLDKAKEEDQAAALALATSGMGDEYQRHKAAADSARSIAAELQRRAYILENGTESNYRQLMFQQYGINNPELNKIAAYFAEKFGDQATLNWLKLQHPAKRPKLDVNGLAMMALLPEGEAAEEAALGGDAEEQSVFDKASDAEDANTNGPNDGASDAGGSDADAKGANLGQSDQAPDGNLKKDGGPAAAEKNDYRATFFAAHPELKGQVVVHHAVEQQVLTRYPGLFTESDINSIENLRGVPTDTNSDLHLSQIRRAWNQFYRSNPNPTREQVLQQARQIDSQFGSEFRPSVKK